MISASQKRNVIPAVCEVEVDCRLLPGQHPEHVEPMIRAVLGGDIDYDLEWIEARGGTRSALDTPLWPRSRSSSPRPSRARGPRRLRAPASPTATGCARRSARSPTASSRRGRAAARGRGVAHPLRRRAHPGCRPRARRRLAAPRGARRAGAEATTLRRDGQGEGPARRYGAPERRARARSAFVGVRDPARGRADRSCVGAQAPAGVTDREPAPAWPCPAGRGAPAPAADQGQAAERDVAAGEFAHARLDARRGGGHPRPPRVEVAAGREGAAVGDCLVRARGDGVALGRARGVSRRGAHLDRQLRAREARDEGARALRWASRRPARRHVCDRQRPRRARARAAPEARAGGCADRCDCGGNRGLRLDDAASRESARAGAGEAGTRAPAPLLDRGAQRRAARGSRGGAQGVPRARACRRS